jgi:predicted O-linked N-acetylglucosamine transferase (SPINDLY family)
LSEYLARHRLADLFLDTLPYNAHATASAALWAGLPVLTCLGQTFSGRVAASLLSAVGLPELVAKDLGDYEAIAIELAGNPQKLLSLRNTLAADRLTHPLFDTARFTRHLESAYLSMWKRHQEGLAPEHIRVARAL